MRIVLSQKIIPGRALTYGPKYFKRVRTLPSIPIQFSSSHPSTEIPRRYKTILNHFFQMSPKNLLTLALALYLSSSVLAAPAPADAAADSIIWGECGGTSAPGCVLGNNLNYDCDYGRVSFHINVPDRCAN
jgi:hypothetical protein